MLIGQITRKRPLGREHADPPVAAEEHRLLVEVAAQRVERAAADHHPDGVDPDVLPEFRIATEHDRFDGGQGTDTGVVVVEVIVIIVGRDPGNFLSVVVERLGEFGGSPRGGAPVDLRSRDDLVDRGHHALPAARDDLADGVPALAASPAGELLNAACHQAQVRVAVEEPSHGGHFAHRAERGDHGQRVGQRAHRGLGGPLGQ